MEVCNHKDTAVLLLNFRPVLHRAEVVADGDKPRGLNAERTTFFFSAAGAAITSLIKINLPSRIYRDIHSWVSPPRISMPLTMFSSDGEE